VKITAQEEYGIRCILQLASRSRGEEPVTVKEIDEREGLSVAYVEKLLRLLSRARLTRSVRGVKGGYCLAASPDEISLGDVIRALGGSHSSADICQRYTGNLECCVHMDDCGIRPVWLIAAYIQSILDRIPLSQLLKGEQMVTSELQAVPRSFSHLASSWQV